METGGAVVTYPLFGTINEDLPKAQGKILKKVLNNEPEKLPFNIKRLIDGFQLDCKIGGLAKIIPPMGPGKE